MSTNTTDFINPVHFTSALEEKVEEETQSPPKFMDTSISKLFTSESKAFTTRIRSAVPRTIPNNKEVEEKKEETFLTTIKKSPENIGNTQTLKVSFPTSEKTSDLDVEFISKEEMQKIKEEAKILNINLRELFDKEFTLPYESKEREEITNFINRINLPCPFSKPLFEFAKRNLKVIEQWEAILDQKKEEEETLPFYEFPPAKKSTRIAEHSLIDYYLMDSRGKDVEPNRKTIVFIRKGQSRRPIVLLSEVVKEEERYQELISLMREREEKITKMIEERRLKRAQEALERKQKAFSEWDESLIEGSRNEKDDYKEEAEQVEDEQLFSLTNNNSFAVLANL
ncbi:hypothetical protein ABK040_009140 [Willaertia magna]